MTTEQVILHRLQELPNYLHLQVIDFLEYLITKHNVTQNPDSPDDDNASINKEHKKILLQRYKKYKDNPDAGEDWEVVKKRLMERYAV